MQLPWKSIDFFDIIKTLFIKFYFIFLVFVGNAYL